MRSTTINVIGSLLTSTILLSLVFRTIKNASVSPDTCKGLLTRGRWSQTYDASSKNVHWQPFGCELHQYDEVSTAKCLSERMLQFVGDSTVRQVFWATAYKLGGEKAREESKNAPKHANLVYQSHGVSLQYRWDTFLNKSETLDLLQDLHDQPQPRSGGDHVDFPQADTAAIVLSSGLWHARYSGTEFAEEYKRVMETAASRIPLRNTTSTTLGSPVIVLPPPVLNHDWLNPERAATLTEPRMSRILQILASTEQSSTIDVAWSTRAMSENNAAALMNNGLHVTTDLAAHQTEILLNKICNNKLFEYTNKASSMCCVDQAGWKLAFSIWLTVMVVSNIVCFFWKRIDHEQNPGTARLQALVTFVVVLCYCWLADRTILFEKSNKIVSEKIFEFCVLATVTVGMVHVTATPPLQEQKLPQPSVRRRLFQTDPGFLTRAQTEEWKGWMQIVILLYHYFGMSKTLWVYQLVRVLVASYLFLTAFGHATYFQRTKDFSITRISLVLLRLNLLPCALAVVMDNEYDFYYFPGLASLWFLITTAVFWRRNSGDLSTKVLSLRVFAAVCIMHLVLGCETVVKCFTDILHSIHGPHINFKEFVFRVKLDIYSPFFGMLVSVAQQREAGCLWSTRMFHPLSSATSYVRSATTLGISCVLLILYTLLARPFADKFVYNRHHSILSLLPISAYLMARNAHPAVRRYTSSMLASVGTYSLELFVLQYHIWLAADTKGLLRLGIIDHIGTSATGTLVGSWRFWLESFVITVVFFWLSKHCANATNTIVKWVVSTDKRCCGSQEQLSLTSSIADKTSFSFSFGCQCQRRMTGVVSAMVVILWLFNILYT
ncbi:hypothetical protein H2198_000574 [Neophaeococcomyces mojaviensis]|uniref:Uncharacterized protein n=1 Tax=Neophaeococcomyces mojaviensis TaxID=3383035 RepID=A0ACC3AK55_9EURO|nr:hypothetical protein H2198_000574 [Knufia sp. JES_112]